MTTLPPRQPCWAIFRGIRRSTRPGDIKRFHEPVKIVTLPFPREDVLAVAHAGNYMLCELARYEGEWQLIELDRIVA